MPIQEIERLSKASSKSQIQAAVSACIATEVRGGTEQQQAIAMCSEMARKQTGGRPAAPKGGG